jgi:hypothetical protein
VDVLVAASMPAEIEAMMSKHFPLHCRKLGAARSMDTVREAIARGRALNFDNPQLPAYVALEFGFGTDFSTNPEYPWAQEILQDRSLPSEPRMERLRSSALNYLAHLPDAGETVPLVSHG